MSRTRTVVDTLESRTGLSPGNSESDAEYVDRLGREFDLSADERERLADLVQREQFAADPTLSPDERRQLDRLCARLSARDEDPHTPDDRAEGHSARAGTAGAADAATTGTTGGTSPDSGTPVVDGAAVPQPSTPSTRTFRADALVPDSLTGRDAVFLLPLVAASAFVFFYGLGNYPLSTWDEGFYANLARHMVQDGYWLTPHMHYTIGLSPSAFEPWLRLPPFGMWLQALSMLAFGVNEFAVRLPSAAASLLTVVVVYFVGRSFRSRRTGFLAGLVYLTTPWVNSGFNAGRDGGLDALLVLFGTLFVYATWLAVKHDDRRWLYPMGVFAGLAVMTKGFGAGVFLLVVLPLVFLHQSTFVSREMVVATAITVLMTVPWPAYTYLRYGDLFVREFFVRYVFDRAAGGAFGTNTNTLFGFMDFPYIKTILFDPGMLHPWSFVLLLAVPAFAYRELSTDGARPSLDTGLLIWWVIASFGLFVFVGEKQWYVMPTYVPAAVLVGGAVDAAIRGRESSATVVAVGVLLAVVLSPAYSLAPEASAIVARTVVLLVGVVAVVWAAPLRDRLTAALPSRPFGGLSRLAPLLVAVVLVAALVGVPSTSGGSVTQQELGLEVAAHAAPGDTVFVERAMTRPFHTFSFYAQRPLDSGTLSEFRASDSRYAVLTTESASQLDSEATVLMEATIGGGQRVSLIEVDR